LTILLDTHAFLWFVGADARLSRKAASAMKDEANGIVLSVASVWEMAIKAGLGKLRLPQAVEAFVPEQMQLNSIGQLAIDVRHAARVEGLPPHHADPFDRLLVAQALTEGLPIISADPAFDAYGVARIW
jgi:PIN domain nuclease of toxin-antitoxin system